MIINAIKTPIFIEGADLYSFLKNHLPQVKKGSIVVVTSKIAALAERRTVIAESSDTKRELIIKESTFAIETEKVWLTVKDGIVMASAGIDESNANGKLILLPRDSFMTAKLIRQQMMYDFGINKLGVLITDSRTAPLRKGVTGIAIGYAGFKGMKSYLGKKDLFGRKFEYSRANIADSLAASAVLVMGEGNESQPLAIIEQAPVEFTNKIYRKELVVGIEEDMYRPLFQNLV